MFVFSRPCAMEILIFILLDSCAATPAPPRCDQPFLPGCWNVPDFPQSLTVGLAYTRASSPAGPLCSPTSSVLFFCDFFLSLSNLSVVSFPCFCFRRALVSQSYLQDAAGAGLSPFVDLAVAQGAVGTVLSTDAEDDAVFGFVTALPLRFLAREHQCAQVCVLMAGLI